MIRFLPMLLNWSAWFGYKTLFHFFLEPPHIRVRRFFVMATKKKAYPKPKLPARVIERSTTVTTSFTERGAAHKERSPHSRG